MEIEVGEGLRARINSKNNTSSIIESPKANGNVFIPHYIEYKDQLFKIVAISQHSFRNNKIDLLTFPEDSEVETFENFSFEGHIKKIKFPPKLKYLGENWCSDLSDLTEIEISPKNPNFIYYNNQYLLGKSQINFDDFDLLYYAKSDIENAIIPSQVKIIKRRSFQNHNKLKTVTFPEDSQLKSIEDFAFASSSINKIKLPASIENISFNCFSSVKNLNEIEIFSKSKTFSIIDKKYLVKKSRGSSEFDILIFARRDIENANIPSQIKVINDYAFQYCKKLKSITFDEDSSLEMINSYAFYQISGPEKIVFPPLLKELGNSSFGGAKNIKVIEFLGDFVRTNSYCFASCSNLSSISFLNASHVTIEGSSFTGIPKNAKINVGRLATLEKWNNSVQKQHQLYKHWRNSQRENKSRRQY